MASDVAACGRRVAGSLLLHIDEAIDGVAVLRAGLFVADLTDAVNDFDSDFLLG
jgi:hypothetical protein